MTKNRYKQLNLVACVFFIIVMYLSYKTYIKSFMHWMLRYYRIHIEYGCSLVHFYFYNFVNIIGGYNYASVFLKTIGTVSLNLLILSIYCRL